MEARQRNATNLRSPLAAELPAAVVIPHTVYAFKPGWLACNVFGVLWAMTGGKPASLPRVSTTSIAALMCCDPRTVRDALDKLVAFGLVDRLDHDGICSTLYVNDPTTIAVARKLVDDPQRRLIDDAPDEGAEIPAQESPPLMFMKHEREISKPCNMNMGAEVLAQKTPPEDAETAELRRVFEAKRKELGTPADTQRLAAALPRVPEPVNVYSLASDLQRWVNDARAPRALFNDVAAAIAAGELSLDVVKGIISECRGRGVRSPGGLFRSNVNKAINGGLRRRPK